MNVIRPCPAVNRKQAPGILGCGNVFWQMSHTRQDPRVARAACPPVQGRGRAALAGPGAPGPVPPAALVYPPHSIRSGRLPGKIAAPEFLGTARIAFERRPPVAVLCGVICMCEVQECGGGGGRGGEPPAPPDSSEGSRDARKISAPPAQGVRGRFGARGWGLWRGLWVGVERNFLRWKTFRFRPQDIVLSWFRRGGFCGWRGSEGRNSKRCLTPKMRWCMMDEGSIWGSRRLPFLSFSNLARRNCRQPFLDGRPNMWYRGVARGG